MSRRFVETSVIGLAILASVAAAVRLGAQGAPVEPCQSFAVVGGAPEDVQAIKALLLRLQDAYRGNTKSTMRFLREFDEAQFVSGFADLERDLQRDFELLHDRELLCRRGTLQIQGTLAVFQGDWEKIAFVGRRFARVEQSGTQRMQLMRLETHGQEPVWRVTGLAGERIFGQTGDFVDVAVTAFPVPSVLPSRRAVTLTATIENLGGTPIMTPILVRFYDATPGTSPVPIGNQTVRGLSSPGRATVSITGAPPRVGRRTFLVVADPDNRLRELDEANNRLAASAIVGADATLVLLPNPNTVTFPLDPLTIRVTDPDQAGAKTVKVRLVRAFQSIAAPGTAISPLHAAVDEEEFALTETRAPGVFERTAIPTGAFFCGDPAGPATPTKGDGRLQFPRSAIPAASGCFDAPMNPIVRDTVAAIYVEAADALGHANVVRRVTATFTYPAAP
jgi:hypothetical protein